MQPSHPHPTPPHPPAKNATHILECFIDQLGFLVCEKNNVLLVTCEGTLELHLPLEEQVWSFHLCMSIAPLMVSAMSIAPSNVFTK